MTESQIEKCRNRLEQFLADLLDQRLHFAIRRDIHTKIEQDDQRLKEELGLDHYEGRMMRHYNGAGWQGNLFP